MTLLGSNFTVHDILGILLAFSLFPLVIVFPGYVFGWLGDLFGFRARLLLVRFAISILLSIAISPILFYLAISLFSLKFGLMVMAFIAIIFLGLLFYEKPRFSKNAPWHALVWLSLGWLVFVICLLVDVQWRSDELYFNVISYDHTTRVSVIDAMTRTGVPPVNPSYYPGHYVKLTFLYFFWYILCCMIDAVGGGYVDARASLFASIVWCGLALMAAIAFYLRIRNGRENGKIWRLAFIGFASLLITGLDIFPALLIMRSGNGVIGDIEHWNEQITAWVGSLFWVPHHVGGLIAGLVGVMLVHSSRGQTRARQFIIMIFCGAAFASAFGLSVWVTLVFVFFWGIWMLFLYLQKEHRTLFLPMLITGLMAFILISPFLFGLITGSGGGTNHAFPVSLTVRSFLFVDVFLEKASFLWKSVIRLLFLPLNYFLELGFFGFIGFIWLKLYRNDLRKNPYYLAEAVLLSVSFFFGTFTRSTLIDNNDLGWRAWLPGQFVLLIWGVDILDKYIKPAQKTLAVSARIKYVLPLLVVVGISTTLLDVTLLRFGYFFSFGPQMGHRIFSARQAYTVLNQVLPEDAIIQYNPDSVINRPSGLYGMHQSAVSDRTAYGIPMFEYQAKVNEVGKIFKLRNVQSWDSLDALCQKESIDVIVIVDQDILWESVDLLAGLRRPLYADDYTTAFFCGHGKQNSTP